MQLEKYTSNHNELYSILNKVGISSHTNVNIFILSITLKKYIYIYIYIYIVNDK